MITSQLHKIGKTIKPHGIFGEILCEFSVDFQDNNFPQYIILEDEGIFTPFFIDEYRQRGTFGYFIKICRIYDEKLAKTLCGKEIFYDKEIDFENDNQDFQLNFLIGYKIIDEVFGEIGKIDNIDESTINTLFVVSEHLIPVADEFILKIDSKKKIIFTKLPEGLLEM